MCVTYSSLARPSTTVSMKEKTIDEFEGKSKKIKMPKFSESAKKKFAWAIDAAAGSCNDGDVTMAEAYFRFYTWCELNNQVKPATQSLCDNSVIWDEEKVKTFLEDITNN